MKVIVEKDNHENDSKPKSATCIRHLCGKTPPLRQAKRSLMRWCEMELLITSVRLRLEFTGAYPPFITPMIKTCHPALDPHHMDGN